MKNCLLLIIDSLNYSHVKNSKVELMPYLRGLERSGVYCTEMYSQAPYTEAAVMNVYCGQNVLDYGGYMRRFADTPLTMFEAMRACGYRTYFNSYQPQCYPSSLRRGVDDIFYNVGYDLDALWAYRLGHYAALRSNGELNDTDIATLIDIFDDNLAEWIAFADDMLCGDAACNMIADNAPEYDASAVKSAVEAEQAKYKEDKQKYIFEVLDQGKAHALYSIPAYVQKGKIKDRAIMPEVKKLYEPLLKEIAKMDRKLNLKNNKQITKGVFRKLGEFCKSPSKTSFKNFLKSGYIAVNAIKDLDLYDRVNEGYDNFKNAPSARTHFDHYVKWADENRDEPHFACVHIDDIHNPEVFFTYDSSDMSLLEWEAAEAQKLLAEIDGDYCGSLTHDLSLRYMDNCIKYLFEEMEKKGILEDTCVMITADHGFSFAGAPLRDSFVINLYLENYNVPFVIANSGREPKCINSFRATKDIPATLLDLAGGEDSRFNASSVLCGDGYENVTIEYCGGGCPDLARREMKIAAFDKEWFVGALCPLYERFDETKITEVYDLKNDPQQLKNLVKTDHTQSTAYLTARIKARLDELYINKDTQIKEGEQS